MADEVKTESEKAPVKGTLLTPDQAGEWGNETILIEKKPKTEANALETEEPEKKEDHETPVAEEVVAKDEPEVTYLEDPGEFTPTDNSFEVTVYDEEGKKPKTVKIDSIEKWDELLESEPNLGSGSAVLKAQRLATKMENNLDREKADWQRSKDEYTKAAEDQERSEVQTTTWANEIAYLEENGSLPKVDAKFKNVPWVGAEADKDALADEAVKAQIDLLEYMRKENTKRRKLGLSDLGPEAAFNSRLRDKGEQQAKENKTKAAEARKVAGARVAGNSPNPVTAAPPGIAVGVGGSLRDLGNTSWK